MTTSLVDERATGPAPVPLEVWANMLWNVFIAIGSALAARQVYLRDEFYNLGDTVQNFVALVALLPAVFAVLGIGLLYQRRPAGRLISMALNYLGMVLAILYLFNLWGFYIGIDELSYTLFKQRTWLLGLAAAYLIFWFAGRMDETNPVRTLLEQGALGLAGLTVIVLLVLGEAHKLIISVAETYGNLDTWLVTALIAVFGMMGWRILKIGEYFGETPYQRTAWQGWLMLSPNGIGFMLFFAGPLLLSLYFSFTDSSGVRPPNWVGADNYQRLLSVQLRWQEDDHLRPQEALGEGYIALDTVEIGSRRLVIGAKDPIFWRSLRNTIVFCLLLVPLSIVPALALALIMNAKIPGMHFFRAIYFLPSVAAVVGTALIWRWLYDANIGYINYAISEGVDFLNSLGLSVTDPKVAWLTDKGTVLLSIVFLAAWQLIGFNTVLFLAGLQGIPRILYEAAYVDGAGRWGQFRHVTLPMLAPTTFFVVVTTVITGLQVFNEPYALIPSRPMPVSATTSVYYLYIKGFNDFEFGYASSVAWLLFALIFTVTLIQFRVSRSAAYED